MRDRCFGFAGVVDFVVAAAAVVVVVDVAVVAAVGRERLKILLVVAVVAVVFVAVVVGESRIWAETKLQNLNHLPYQYLRFQSKRRASGLMH
jgi:hypothetical protein